MVLQWLSRSKTPQTRVIEPPPSVEKRKAKESQWFSSISKKDIPHPQQAVVFPAQSTSAALEAHALTPKSNTNTNEPAISRKRSFLSRKKSNSTIRPAAPTATIHKAKSVEQISTYQVVQPNGVVIPLEQTPPKADAVIKSSSIATKLQELSEAHENGLLDDEEYRALRQVLFQKSAEKETASHSPLYLHSMPAIDQGSQTDHRRLSIATSHRPSSIKSEAHSLKSVKSTLSGFLKPTSRAKRQEWHNLNAIHRESMFRETSSSSSEMELMQQSLQSAPSTLSSPESTRRISLLPPLPSQMSTSNDLYAQSMRRGYSSSSAASFKSVSTSGKTSNSRRFGASSRSRELSYAGSYNSHGWETDSDAYSDAHSTEIQAEIASLISERDRLLAQFDSLKKMARDKFVAREQADKDVKDLRLSPAADIHLCKAQNDSDSQIISSRSRSRLDSMKAPIETDRAQAFMQEIEALKLKRAKIEARYEARLEYLRLRMQGSKLKESIRQ